MSVMPYEPDGFFDILDWKPFTPMETWMEKEVVVLDGGNKGSFSTYRMPHMSRIFQEVDKIRVIKITLMFASQAGKTITLVNVVLKRMDTDPDNSIIMFPKGNQVKKLYDNKVKPYIEGCETIVKKMEDFAEDTKSHQSSYSKKIAGAILSVLDANNTKSVSAKTIVFDEVSDFPSSKIGEAIERLKSFDGKGELALLASTRDPYKEGKDEITHHFNISEIKLQYWANCRECNHKYYPEPETLVYPSVEKWKESQGLEGDIPKVILLSEYASYVRMNTKMKCPECGHEINNSERKEQILNREFDWVEVVPLSYNEDGTVEAWQETNSPKQEYTSVGFDVNTLCIEGFDMGKIAEKIVQDTYGENTEKDLQHTYVGFFNRPYIPDKRQSSRADVLLISNAYEEWQIPDDTIALYVGVDSQKDHFWVTVVAYEYDMVSHLVHAARVEDFASIVDIVEREYYYGNGKRYYQGVKRIAIDSQGYYEKEKFFNEETQQEDEHIVVDIPLQVREFVYEMSQMWGSDKDGHERIYATRGHDFLPNDEYYGFASTQVKVGKYDDVRKIKTIKLGTVQLKAAFLTTVYRNIDKQKATEDQEAYLYNHRLHYINRDTINYVKQLEKPSNKTYDAQITAERFGYSKNKKGNERKAFHRMRKDNHFLDCMVQTTQFAIMDNLASMKKPEEKKEKFSLTRSIG